MACSSLNIPSMVAAAWTDLPFFAPKRLILTTEAEGGGGRAAQERAARGRGEDEPSRRAGAAGLASSGTHERANRQTKIRAGKPPLTKTTPSKHHITLTPSAIDVP